MHNVRASWLALVAALMPSCVCAQPTLAPSIVDHQRAARDRQIACFKQVQPQMGADDEKWQEFRNCVARGIAPAAATQGVNGQVSVLLASAETSFDGDYHNVEGNFSFKLDTKTRTAIATLSNSPRYRVGQIMLRYRMTGARDFVGEQLFTDGKFHPITGIFLDDGTIKMRGVENVFSGQWTMMPIPGSAPQTNSPQAQSPPPVGAPSASPLPSGYAADAAQCDSARPFSESAKTIAACTRLIAAGRAKFGNRLPVEFAGAFFVRATMYGENENFTSAIADFSELIGLRPDFALAYVERGASYVSAGQLALAMHDLDRAIELAQRMPPTDGTRDVVKAGALEFRATAYAKMGEYRRAVQDYNDCKEQFPSFPWLKMDPALAKAIETVQAQQQPSGNSSTGHILLPMMTTLRLECVYDHSSDTGYVFIDMRSGRLTTEYFSFNVQDAPFQIRGDTLSWAVNANWSYSLNLGKLEISSSLPFPDWHCLKR